jgi:hypothetical protein
MNTETANPNVKLPDWTQGDHPAYQLHFSTLHSTDAATEAPFFNGKNVQIGRLEAGECRIYKR